MPVTPISQTADQAGSAEPPAAGTAAASAFSDRPLCVHHQGDVTVVVYSSPTQEPKRLNHPILPSLHIMLVEEGKEIEGLVAILADYLTSEPPITDDPAASTKVMATISTDQSLSAEHDSEPAES